MIEVEHLSKVYGSTPAITDVTFRVEPGEIVGFLGPNGAGKTTTMRVLSGYLPATSGTARIAGYDVHDQSLAVRQRIGYLPENPPLYPEMTVRGFLHFVAQIKGVAAGDRSEKVQAAIQRCNLQDKEKVIIRKLSKGYRQRVGIAQAIVHDPPAIILDEPTVGLDPRQIMEVRNLIKSLAGTHTIILSTHILPEVSMTCSRVVIINRGKIVAINSPENLMTQLTEGSGYELEIAGDVSLAKQMLEKIPGINLVVSMSSHHYSSTDHTCLRVISQPGKEPGKDIVNALNNAGFDLYEMRRVNATLEDVFLELTTSEKTISSNIDSEVNPDIQDEQNPTMNLNQEVETTEKDAESPGENL
ncbi:ABC transporter ATP-binding protein [Anabaena sp. FACHB-1237]|uniref:ABC transporter ATP-binding protein n=1 Tax=Anabaena sp. FACHB-1237 TaxID=2692769 RepID=UPI001681A34C|nr:ABC transporter ATP-binding protein [Anabaena sp. FACHB-1237]MBD2136486.1 ABC transporter ATP-binding protein [Anabaena sp. FACHB-1237]